eukprot:snap_masked-scaffold_3-processed-gene-9.6-mRNA-1 protein AED:1.00 eAED:1.00 QI:0/-1/0/0/-1/1/1/0/450
MLNETYEDCLPKTTYSSILEKLYWVFVLLHIVCIGVSIPLWIKFKKKEPALKVRIFENVVMLDVAWALIVLTNTGNRLFPVQETLKCFPFLFILNFPFPVFVLILANRLFEWLAHIRSNESLANEFNDPTTAISVTGFKEVEKLASKQSEIKKKVHAESVKGSPASKWLSKLSTKRNQVKLDRLKPILVGASLVVLVSFLSYSECDRGMFADVCANQFGISFFLPHMIASFIGVGLSVYVQRLARTMPDPYLVLREIRNGFLLAVASAFAVVLSMILPRKNEDGVAVGLSWFGLHMVLISMAYANSTVAPLIVVWVFRTQGVTPKISLEEVLASKTGTKLFRGYLVHEFSVENLNFYENVMKWKNNFQTMEIHVREDIAKALFARFMGGKDFLINVSDSVIVKTKTKFEVNEITFQIFDEALTEIFRIMKQDSFPRFAKTKLFKKFSGME